MRCDWLDAPRSPEPGVSVTACDLDNRYQKFRGAAAAAVSVSASARLGAGAHARATRSLREAALEPETVELATACKTDATGSSYVAQIR